MPNHPNLLVGINTGDDAAVYRIKDDLCMVNTVDFFPPIVDDPYDFGSIAVANAISDVYAMGGKPILGLNLVCFPEDLPKEILYRILQGGSDKAEEAGMLIAGGHTITDKEPKYGMAVTGLISSGRILTNVGAKPGDQLVLTKPIGTGIITTAGKLGLASELIIKNAVHSMATLNKSASEAVQESAVRACTDVTGFGLIGHLHAMMEGSGTTADIKLSSVPVLDGARELLLQGIVPGGTHRNFETVGKMVDWNEGLSEEDKLLLCDAQTSGGLLVAVPPERLHHLIEELETRETLGAIIGSVSDKSSNSIRVSP